MSRRSAGLLVLAMATVLVAAGADAAYLASRPTGRTTILTHPSGQYSATRPPIQEATPQPSTPAQPDALATWRSVHAPLLERLERDGLSASLGASSGAYDGALRDCQDIDAVVAQLGPAHTPAPPTDASARALGDAAALYEQAAGECEADVVRGPWVVPLDNAEAVLRDGGLWVAVG